MRNHSVLGPYHDRFLEDYWQRRPLLIRGAFPGGLSSVDPDSLAGLACQEGIDSRIIIEKGDYPWQKHQGPFEESFFETLPKTHWALLVQAVDRLLPDVSVLRSAFTFIPNWRLDDIMISYAADQGSVGPHTDNYDVFLIQALGRRRWDYGESPLDEAEFIDGLDLRILKDFKVDHSFILEAGDMLYLPPRVAHHGVAMGECMTYSVGFRAPTQNEMLISFSQFLMQSENPEVFFTDRLRSSDAGPLKNPGLIADEDLARLRDLMIASVNDDRVFRRWIGAFLTEPRHFHEASDEPLDWRGLSSLLREEETIDKVEGGRFAYHKQGPELYLAVEGESLVLPASLGPLVILLCENESYSTQSIRAFEAVEGYSELLLHLWNQGFIRRSYE